MRLTPGAGLGSLPTAPPAGHAGETQRRAGIAAIFAAAVLLLVAGVLWFQRPRSVPAPPDAPPAAQTAAPEAVPPAAENRKRVVPTGGGRNLAAGTAGSPAQDSGGAAMRSEPAAIAPLRRLFEQSKEATAAPGEALPVGKRPQPLGFPPAVTQGGESGVLIWSGYAPASGGQVIIYDGSQVGGPLSGDALPGVPVRVNTDNPDIAVTEAPGPGNGNRRLVLRVPANLTKPIRINWQVLKGGRQ